MKRPCMRFLPFLLVLFACGKRPGPDADAVPKALQDPSVITEVKGSLSRSGYGYDLVDALFAEELQKDTALARLVKELERQEERHRDSIRTYERYKERITGYHADAAQWYNSISDSLLSIDIRQRNLAALERFHAFTGKHRQALWAYDSLARRNADLLILLKLHRTLPVLEAYREKALPGNAVLEQEVQRAQALEQRLQRMLAP